MSSLINKFLIYTLIDEKILLPSSLTFASFIVIKFFSFITNVLMATNLIRPDTSNTPYFNLTTTLTPEELVRAPVQYFFYLLLMHNQNTIKIDAGITLGSQALTRLCSVSDMS